MFATAFDDLRKRYANRFDWHRRIIERYKDGNLTVHLHAWASCWGIPGVAAFAVASGPVMSGPVPEMSTWRGICRIVLNPDRPIGHDSKLGSLRREQGRARADSACPSCPGAEVGGSGSYPALSGCTLLMSVVASAGKPNVCHFLKSLHRVHVRGIHDRELDIPILPDDGANSGVLGGEFHAI